MGDWPGYCPHCGSRDLESEGWDDSGDVNTVRCDTDRSGCGARMNVDHSEDPPAYSTEFEPPTTGGNGGDN